MSHFTVKKCQKWSILASFWNPEACGQTVLPDRSVLVGQKLVENTKIFKKWDILTLCNFLKGQQQKPYHIVGVVCWLT